jgi:hypothetical protein
MKRARHYLSFALLSVIAVGAGQLVSSGTALANGNSYVVIKDGGVVIKFPDTITFKANVSAPASVERVVLEYGVEQLTCGTVTAKAFPQFKTGTSVDVSWTWEMRKSGSEPPGAHIWYRWRATDKAGHETLSDKQIVTWIDTEHKWISITQGSLTLHWYQGTQNFAQSLLDFASKSLAQLKQQTGVDLQSPVDLYIYASTADLQKAVLYEPSWTGGQAFPEHGIVIIGISTTNLEWGEHAEAHELTHVLVGHLAFSCLANIPGWLNEGIAVYGQGGPEPDSLARLNDAIKTGNLLSIQALSGQFSEKSDKADLSYSQSFSVVNYLIAHFGQEKLNALFKDISQGVTIDAALHAIYGFGLDGLDAGWRKSVGAPESSVAPAVAATAMPTAVPTYPLHGMPTASTRLPVTPMSTPVGVATVVPAHPSQDVSTKIENGTDTAAHNATAPLLIAAVFLLPVIPALAGGYIFFKNRKSR